MTVTLVAFGLSLLAIAVSGASLLKARRRYRATVTDLRARQLDDVIAHDNIDPRRRT